LDRHIARGRVPAAKFQLLFHRQFAAQRARIDRASAGGEVGLDRAFELKIRAAGVNPVETYIRAGIYARKPQLPYTPGTDGAGIVSSVGPDAGEGVQCGGHSTHRFG
jgi:hypothetical protein